MRPHSAPRVTALAFAIAVGLVVTGCSTAVPDPCKQGEGVVRSISEALDEGLEATDAAQVATTLEQLRGAVSDIPSGMTSVEGKALWAVRGAAEDLASTAGKTEPGTSKQLSDRIDALILRIGELDKACEGSILSPQA